MLPHAVPSRTPDSVDTKYMANFRETNWFKRGELVDVLPADDSVELPIEDRYLDEGNTTYTDSALYGVHTGETTRIPSWMTDTPDVSTEDFAIMFRTARNSNAAPDLQHLIRELKQRNRTIAAMCGAAMIVLGVVVFGVL